MSRRIRPSASAAASGHLRLPAAGWGWAATGGTVGLLGALLLFAPARWLADGAAQASGGRLLLSAPRGTVWSGSAQPVFTGGAGSGDAVALPDRLHWRLRPAWGGVSAHLSAACCTPTPVAVRAALHWGGVRMQVADGTSRWPAALLAGLGTPWNTLQPQGELALRTQDVVLDAASGRLHVDGSAQLDAVGISTRLSPLRPMGSYRLALNGGDVPALRLETLPGSTLQLTGAGQWVGNRLRFAGEAFAAPAHEAALSNLLNIIGRRSGARSAITVG